MKKIDRVYYNKIRSVLKGEPTIFRALFANNYEKERIRFLDKKAQNPLFSYDEFSVGKYGETIRKIESLKKFLASEKNLIVKKLYLDRLNELRLKADLRYWIGKDCKKFHQLSNRIYGKPTSTEYRECLKEFRQYLKIYTKTKKEIDSRVIKKIFASVLKDLDLGGWKIVILKKSHSITINAKHENGPRIEIPETRRVNLIELEQLVHHEIITHLLRGISGQRSKLALIGFFGADNYSATEEGLAIFNEEWVSQKREVKPSKFYFRGTIAIGAAMEGRDFRETYNYLISLGFSRESGWKHTYRVFRGISDTSIKTGEICTLDWIYRKGNKEIKSLVKKRGDSIIDKLYIGKIGIHHLRMMKKLKLVKPVLTRQYINIEKYL